MISHQELLIVTAAVLVVLVVGVILLARTLRSQFARRPESVPGRTTRVERTGRDWAVTPLPTGLARTLTQRGLVNAQELASMSPAEREFFVTTVAARVGEGAKPRLIGAKDAEQRLTPTGTPSLGGTAGARAGAGVPVGARPIAVLDGATLASLVSGGIHCPVCRTPVGQRSETLLISRCPGCGRRVAARVDGDRLIVTVDYKTKD